MKHVAMALYWCMVTVSPMGRANCMRRGICTKGNWTRRGRCTRENWMGRRRRTRDNWTGRGRRTRKEDYTRRGSFTAWRKYRTWWGD
jgi:hypothetical protein